MTPSKMTLEERIRLKELSLSLTLRQLAQSFGTTVATIEKELAFGGGKAKYDPHASHAFHHREKWVTRLTIEERREILTAIDRGETNRSLSQKYSVSDATIGNIKKKREKIMKTSGFEENSIYDSSEVMQKLESIDARINLILDILGDMNGIH